MPLEIWERRAEASRDRRLTLRPRGWLARPQIMPDVLVGEDVVGEFEIAERPDFLVEAQDKRPSSHANCATT
jgi:hypothetical protein